MAWLVRFGYDGTAFSGWAQQPGLRTVEGDLRRGLVRAGVLPQGSARGLEVASRTDRGVSARANALKLISKLSGSSLLRLLNGFSSEIFFSAAVEVPDGFRVRQATRRVYRYFEAAPIGGVNLWSRAAKSLTGRIDVRSFGRRIPPETPCWRTVESVSIRAIRQGAVIEIRAPSFVWGMIRKMIGAMREHGAGRLSLPELDAAVNGEKTLHLPLAEPERLVLWRVEYPFRWEVFCVTPNRNQTTWARREREGVWVRGQVLRALARDESLRRE